LKLNHSNTKVEFWPNPYRTIIQVLTTHIETKAFILDLKTRIQVLTTHIETKALKHKSHKSGLTLTTPEF
jgi:hypothetical protein